jgi:hypothetical protein
MSRFAWIVTLATLAASDQSPHHPLATGGWVGVGPPCRGYPPTAVGASDRVQLRLAEL